VSKSTIEQNVARWLKGEYQAGRLKPRLDPASESHIAAIIASAEPLAGKRPTRQRPKKVA
jgi:hypothetical protein